MANIALVVVWVVGIGFGYWLAWMRYGKRYVLVEKKQLKYNRAQMATQVSKSNPRCACCKTTSRNETDTGFSCGCVWSAKDLLMSGDDYMCTMHRRFADEEETS